MPVTVKDAKVDRPISFKLDVMPVFMQAGCNTGSCHGAARGKDGFRLSLFGFDPDGDYYRLTREINGRRINLALPRESLLLEKADGTVPHTGGKRLKEDSELLPDTSSAGSRPGVRTIRPTWPRRWRSNSSPSNAVLEGKGATQQMIVRAQYSDGTERDVTSLAVFLSNNDNSATISPDGWSPPAHAARPS